MQHKTLLLTALLILATLLSACVTVNPQTGNVPRTLSVNGSARITLTPDIAYISTGVHTESENAQEAVASNTTQAQKVIDALKALGLDDKDIQTTNFNVYPSQQYDNEGRPTVLKFMVDNTVYVTLRDLSKVGEALAASVDAGANNIYGIQFDVEDKTAALSEARKAAVADAKRQAEELAQASGATLGAVQTISFYNPYPTPIMDAKGGGGYDMANAAVPVSPGQMTITVDVSVIYEIK
jgi:hypothetical protein